MESAIFGVAAVLTVMPSESHYRARAPRGPVQLTGHPTTFRNFQN